VRTTVTVSRHRSFFSGWQNSPAVYTARTGMEPFYTGGETMAKKTTNENGLQELKAALKNKIPERLYFFHGEETFLLHHYLGQLRKILLDPLTESFNYHRLNNETFDIRSFAVLVL
jgi:hypothetical protein